MEIKEMVKTVGLNIRLARVAKRWTQKKLSQDCTLTEANISLIENGLHDNVSLFSLVKIINSLGNIEITDLFSPMVMGNKVSSNETVKS